MGSVVSEERGGLQSSTSDCLPCIELLAGLSSNEHREKIYDRSVARAFFLFVSKDGGGMQGSTSDCFAFIELLEGLSSNEQKDIIV